MVDFVSGQTTTLMPLNKKLTNSHLKQNRKDYDALYRIFM